MASVEGISISLENVTSTAGTIRNINTSLGERLEDIKKQMNDLASSWQSPAAETIRTKFNALIPTFENYKKIVDSYAKFLDDTVSSYSSTETALNNRANAFK